jgi:GLPGLI family protein
MNLLQHKNHLKKERVNTMKQNISRGILLAALLLMSMSIALGQGLYWESITTVSTGNGKEISSASYYRTHMFKQVSEKNAMIFRLDKEILYTVDHERKEYSVMTFAELEAFSKKASSEMNEKMSAMKEQMKNMPPEQRKMMEQMMGKQAMGKSSESKIEVKKTSEKKTINGFPCIKYALMEDGKETGNVWTTSNVPNFKTMQKDFQEFSERITAQMPMKGGQLAEAMKKIEGFPIQTSIAGFIINVKKVEKKSIAVSEFEVPAGYKKVDPKTMIGTQE